MRISIVVGGLRASTRRLQPWRYLAEVAAGLSALGHQVELLSDGLLDGLELGAASLWSPYGRAAGTGRPSLAMRLAETEPDIVLWNVGVTSALPSRRRHLPRAHHIAVFTSPLYGMSDLARLGPSILADPWSYAALGLGSVVPRRWLARYLARSFERVIFLGRSTARAVVAAGLPADRALVVPPGRDLDVASRPALPTGEAQPVQFVVAGSPAPIRGADVLLRAFADARAVAPNARLVVLSRHERPELAAWTAELVGLAGRLGILPVTEFIEGTLPRTEFVDRLARADVMVLPFRLVPSEAPLAVLEAAGAGLPLIASDLPAVRDLAAPGSQLVPAGSQSALRDAIQRLAADPSERERCAALARQWYADWPSWAATCQTIARALGGEGGAGSRGRHAAGLPAGPERLEGPVRSAA